jgi:hypothetical protein
MVSGKGVGAQRAAHRQTETNLTTHPSALPCPLPPADQLQNIFLAIQAGFALARHTPQGVTEAIFYSLLDKMKS